MEPRSFCLQIPSEIPPAVPQSPGRTILPAVGVTAVNQNYFGAWLKKGKGWPWSGRKNDGRKPAESGGRIFMACPLEE